MFLTHDGWRRFLGLFERVAGAEIEPLDGIYRYRHHTLIDVALHPAGAAPVVTPGATRGIPPA